MTDSELKAYNGGYNSAKRGLSIEDNPYPPDIAEYDMWKWGFYDYFYE